MEHKKEKILPPVPSFSSIHSNASILSNEESDKSIQKTIPHLVETEDITNQEPLLPPLPYNPPEWSGLPSEQYYLEVIKNGVPIENVSLDLKREFIMIVKKVPLAAFIGNFEAFLGEVFLLDLKSIHGTFVNKARLNPYQLEKLDYGSVIKFGQSSRIYIWHGSKQNEMIALEDRELKLEAEKEASLNKKILKTQETNADTDEDDDHKETEGISWGMSFDDDDEVYKSAKVESKVIEDVYGKSMKAHVPKHLKNVENNNESDHLQNLDSSKVPKYYVDPKRHLHQWLEEQRLIDNFSFTFLNKENVPPFEAIIELNSPIYSQKTGKYVQLRAVGTANKKKEAERIANLKFCKLLDSEGMFEESSLSRKRESGHERDDNDNDDDDDDDEYFDRTKRKKVIIKENPVETYDSLIQKKADCEAAIKNIQEELATLCTIECNAKLKEDELDKYIDSLESTDQRQVFKSLIGQIQELKLKHNKLERLITIVKPKASDLMFLGSANKNTPEINKGNAKAKISTSTSHQSDKYNNTEESVKKDKLTTQSERINTQVKAVVKNHEKEITIDSNQGTEAISKKTKHPKPTVKTSAPFDEENEDVEWLPPESGSSEYNL